ncbi:hypothetical protein E8E13_008759 [Curvularia kusanoi]|uniref:Uncharacterized protein n=1 Tax=Curvularia kusanoi TaxID=90978 RepID=A0A9P4TI53_CURKU|nr:hypothetical protein E8E13_008759 [Curvularia kusanoi]
MIASRFLVVASLVVASSASLITRQDALLTSLLKRQEPSTPAYNCHDNCGSAIKLSRVADPCNNAVFIADYNNCIKCSGPDNYNIWRYYGGSLSSTGAKCGLDTEPVSGKQEDVPPAGSTGAAPSATPNQTATIAISSAVTSAEASAAPTQSSVSEPLSSAAVATSGEPSEAPVSSAITTAVAISAFPSDSAHSTAVANGMLSSSVPGESSPSSNAGASSTASAPAQVTVNAAGSLHAESAASVFGAIFIGAIFGM